MKQVEERIERKLAIVNLARTKKKKSVAEKLFIQSAVGFFPPLSV